MYDWLIVGAGLSGVTLAERITSQLNQSVLIVDKRLNVGGNVHDEYNAHGVLVHVYGPHIFHTNRREVWKYLSRFTKWRPYFHKVHAVVEGKNIPLPFNLNSLYTIFPSDLAGKLEMTLLQEYAFGEHIPILQLRESNTKELRLLGEYVYEKIFYNYTIKQWGLKPEELDPLVTGRVPIRISRDDRYFRDAYQGVPKYGYSRLIRKMIDHPNIKVLLNTDYKEVINEVKFNRLVYTGPIDDFFDMLHGKLPYRSVRFELVTEDRQYCQDVGTINYPNEYDFTRATEYKHLTGQNHAKSTIVYEYPIAEGDPYYPVPNNENAEIYRQYEAEAAKLKTVYFTGRLAEYRYFNMDEVVNNVLVLFEKIVKGH